VKLRNRLHPFNWALQLYCALNDSLFFYLSIRTDDLCKKLRWRLPLQKVHQSTSGYEDSLNSTLCKEIVCAYSLPNSFKFPHWETHWRVVELLSVSKTFQRLEGCLGSMELGKDIRLRKPLPPNVTYLIVTIHS